MPPPAGAKSKTLAASTIVPSNTYPLDHGFYDRRIAGHVGWEQAITSDFKIDGGIAYSREHDYRSESANIGIAQDFNGHNTTLSAAVNYESGLSFPIGGTPTPLTQMNGNWKGPDAALHEVDAVVGVTQVMNRRWLTTVSYGYTDEHGYQSDPYKLVSLVDPISGQPTEQIYESRPNARRKQSIFFDNKVHLSRDVICASLRGYQDNWGIKSLTADLRYRWQIGPAFYLEPHLRYYTQSAADFFRYYLAGGDPVPQYVSADTRLAKFHAQTYGAKLGIPFSDTSEINLRIEYYDQHGNGSPAGAIGQLQHQDLFPDLKAYTLLLGYTFAF